MKRFAVVLLIVAMALGYVFAGGSKEAAVSDKDTYVFASDCTWPPFEYVDSNGNIVGFEIELVEAIGKAVGKNFTIKNTPWDSIFAGLANGAYDAIASGVTVLEERKATMDFADPFLNVGQVVIVRIADKDKVSGIDDLNGKKVGVQMGTTGDFALDDYDVMKAQYDEIGLAVIDLANGNLDAAVCDSLIASDFVLNNDNYKGELAIVGEPFTTEEIALVVKKGDTVLLDLINKGQKMLVEDGTLAALKKKWNLI